MKKDSVFLGIAAGVLTVVLLTALAVGILLSGDRFYVFEINNLAIEQSSGLEKDVILDNYNAVTEFLSPFNKQAFSMPDLPASTEGVGHFEDVKAILLGLYIAGLISLTLIVPLFILFRKSFGKKTLMVTAGSVMALPLTGLAAIAVDFDWFFTLFHKIFFSNDNWIFDAVTDPVINILPEIYFIHCALIIAAFWVLGSAAFFLAGIKRGRDPRAATPD